MQCNRKLLVGMKNPSLIKRTAPNRGLVNICTEKEANAYLLQMQKDGMPPFSSKLLVSINQYIHKPEESIEERFKLIEISTQAKEFKACTRDISIFQSYYVTMRNICTIASKDLLQQVVTHTELCIIFNHFISLLKYAISRENKGVIIDETCLHEAILLVSKVFESLHPSQDIIEDYLKSLASATKQASVVPSQDSGVGYFLCHNMTECFTYLVVNKINSADKALMMMHKTGILEQALRHIHLPWTPLTNERETLVRLFFITLASSLASLGSMFKAGSPTRDALVDILQGRIKPCTENEHMMEILEALKKFIDMGLTSGNPDEKYISRRKIECAKCGKQDSKLLVCAKCKLFRYCSRECQVAHWKDHKGRCKEYASAAKTKNLEAIANKFMLENHPQLLEKLRKIYDGGDVVLDLDFSNQSSPALPPALRNPPEFEVFPADIFWNREKDKAPAGHWFFKDFGGGKTTYSDEYMKYVREVTESRSEKVKSDYFNVYVFLNISDTQQIIASALQRDAMKANYNQSEERKKDKSYQDRRQEYIQKNLDQMQLTPSVIRHLKTLSSSEKEEYFKNSEKLLGNLFDAMDDALSKTVI